MKYPKVIYNGPPKSHSWVRWCVNRVKNQNNSTNIRFIGDTGSGKSWSALATCELMAKLMGKKITEDNIYFSISEVIRKVAKNPPKPGTIFFIDEQQVEGDSNTHNTLKGRAYTAFFSTVRSKRYIIVSTMPYADMVIKKVRRFFHVEIETKGVNEKLKVVRTSPRYLEYHKSKDKVYRKRLVVIFVDKSTGIKKGRKITHWEIPKPSNEIINLYEALKADFQQKTYEKLVRDLNKFEGIEENEKGAEVPEEIEDIVMKRLTDYQRDLYEVLNKYPSFKHRELSEVMETKGHHSSPAKVSQNLQFMRNKGVVIKRQKGMRIYNSR